MRATLFAAFTPQGGTVVPEDNLKLVMLAALVLLGGACDAGGDADTDRPGPADAALVERVERELVDWMTKTAAERAEQTTIAAELKRPARDLEELEFRHVELLRSLYGSRDHRPAWLTEDRDGARLNHHGRELLAGLNEAETKHGLWIEDYHVPVVRKLSESVDHIEIENFEHVGLKPDEREALVDYTREHRGLDEASLARAMADDDGPTPRIAQLVARRAAAQTNASTFRARLDLYLSDGLIEYGFDMRWDNGAWYRDHDWPDRLEKPRRNSKAARRALEEARKKLVAERELLPVFDSPDRVQPLLHELVPPHEQYARLLQGYQTYRKIVADGGWEKIPDEAGELKRGDESEHVATLKRRLKAEGYWNGDTGKKFTRSLEEALKRYQESHQLWENGKTTPETRLSLNVGAERRLEQIRVSLERWRESSIGHDDTYVFVNIPDFHLEVWENGERTMRFKTVVGSTKLGFDEHIGHEIFVHETPQVSSEISHVVFNPYWWVPKDIAEEELEPELEADPLHFVENGYEYAVNEEGDRVVRQLPGPDNALGKVKFMFDSGFSIYLHDTPEQKLFRWPARAFSHGCVRLERPMEFAERLLTREGRWDEAKVSEYLEDDGEKWIKLEQPIPVHLEYYVVRVDDLGRVNFLADLYRHDAKRLSIVDARKSERRALGVEGPDTALARTVEPVE